MTETLEAWIRRLTSEEVAIVPYDPCWPDLFEREKARLIACLPTELVRRVEHFDSTAMPRVTDEAERRCPGRRRAEV